MFFDGIHKWAIKIARNYISGLVRKSIKDEKLEEIILLLLEIVEDVAHLLTDDDKDNTAQLKQYLQNNGVSLLSKIMNILFTEGSEQEKEKIIDETLKNIPEQSSGRMA